jgi:ABC-2 type transport system ATP-binding protein
VSSGYAIETEALSKTYQTGWRKREVRAVEQVSLRVREGTTFGLLGPNGAGKTTFVKMLLSAVRPSAGAARLFGRDARDSEARRPIGYLPENHRFPTYYTARGMLDCYAALSGVAGAERARRIPALLERVGLRDWADVRLGKFSKGMLQRVGLAQAMIHRPRLLILDEPSDGVDPVGRIEIREILRELEREGTTIFLNSHLLVEVELFCRDVAILHRGRLALEGSVEALTAGSCFVLAAVGPDGPVESRHATREEANRELDRLRAAGHEVESLRRESSTLEQIFVDTVKGAAA